MPLRMGHGLRRGNVAAFASRTFYSQSEWGNATAAWLGSHAPSGPESEALIGLTWANHLWLGRSLIGLGTGWKVRGCCKGIASSLGDWQDADGRIEEARVRDKA